MHTHALFASSPVMPALSQSGAVTRYASLLKNYSLTAGRRRRGSENRARSSEVTGVIIVHFLPSFACLEIVSLAVFGFPPNKASLVLSRFHRIAPIVQRTDSGVPPSSFLDATIQ
jgi:hypothetical protein